MKSYIVVAEKPSVARNLRSFFKYNGIDAIMTSAKGHIMGIDFPKKFRWGRVRPIELFDVVDEIKFYVKDRKTYSSLYNLFQRYRNRVLVIATDNDSEGELIGYEILRIYWDVRGRDTPYYRMRFNSLEYKELKRSWIHKESSLKWNMVNKALFRAYFDLVTGAAFTRLLTEEGRKHKRVRLISWGSCQTPTLYFVVERERQRINFKREKYWYIEALFLYNDRSFKAKTDNIRDSSKAREYYRYVSNAKEGIVDQYQSEKFIDKRPLPLMTDYMLRDLVRITGKAATTILSTAEELYSEGYCVTPDTLVVLDNGEIIEIQQLDDSHSKVIGYEFKFEPVNVLKILKRVSPKKVIKITTTTNRELTVTPDHPILVVSRDRFAWKEAKDIKVGDILIVSKYIHVNRTRDYPTLLHLIDDIIPDREKWKLRIILRKELIDKLRRDLSNLSWINKYMSFNRLKYSKGIAFLADKFGIKKSTMYRWFSSQRIPYPIIRWLIEEDFLSLSEFRESYQGITFSSGKNGTKGVLKIPFYLDEDFAYFIGLVIAEGYLRGSHLAFSVKLNEEKEFEKVIRQYSRNYNLHLIKPNKRLLVFTNAKTLNFILEHLGINEGAKSQQVYIHRFLLRQPENFVLGLLAGIWDGDGMFHSKSRPQAVLSTCSKKLQRQIELLLRQFGIDSSYIKSKIYGTSGIKIYFNYIPVLVKVLEPFIRIRRNELKLIKRKYQQLIKKRKYIKGAFLVPNTLAISIIGNLPITILERKLKISLQNVKYKGADMPEAFFSKLIDYIGEYQYKDLGFEKVKEVKIIDSQYKEVYDLTTSSSNFLANGILVHNCSYPRTETDKYPKDFDFYKVRDAVLKSDLRSDIELYIKFDPDPRNGRRDDKAHPPIYPIRPYPKDDTLKWIVWEYVARRFIANSFSEDAFGFRQRAVINVNDILFNASGLYYGRYGYYRVYPYFRPKESPIPRLIVGDKVRILDVSLKTGYTKPPDRLSEAELLMVMERNGIGTDATRALYPKLITQRKYAFKKRGRFVPTKLGMKFIESLENIDGRLVTPETRKYVEGLMNMVGEGGLSLDDALKESLNRYKELFKEILDNIHKVSETLSEGLIDENNKK